MYLNIALRQKKLAHSCSVWTGNIHISWSKTKTKKAYFSFKPCYYPLMTKSHLSHMYIYTCSSIKCLLDVFNPVLWTCSVGVECIYKAIYVIVTWDGSIESLLCRPDCSHEASHCCKNQKRSVLTGSARWGESCSPVLFLKLVSGQLRHDYTTSAVLYNSSKAPSTFNLNYVKLVSITLGHKMRVTIFEYTMAFHM